MVLFACLLITILSLSLSFHSLFNTLLFVDNFPISCNNIDILRSYNWSLVIFHISNNFSPIISEYFATLRACHQVYISLFVKVSINNFVKLLSLFILVSKFGLSNIFSASPFKAIISLLYK